MVKRGHIVEQGPHDELMSAAGAYYTLIQMQQATGEASDEDAEEEGGAGAGAALEALPEESEVRAGSLGLGCRQRRRRCG